MNDEGEIKRVSLTPAAAPLFFHSNVCGSLDLLKGLGNHVGGRADALPIPAVGLTTQRVSACDTGLRFERARP